MKGSRQLTKSSVTVHIDTGRCKGCGLCISVCPREALYLDEQINQSGFKPVRFSEEAGCNGCQRCYLMCPDLAILVVRKKGTEGI